MTAPGGHGKVSELTFEGAGLVSYVWGITLSLGLGGERPKSVFGLKSPRCMAFCSHLNWKHIGTLLLACVCLALPGRADWVNGHSYLSLADWAAANHLKISRNSAGDEFTVSGKTTRLVFGKDSNIAEINGVNVALSFPLAVAHGVPLVSQLDLARTISPLVFTPKFAPKKITTICLDPGHGGKDTGNHVGAHYEKIYTLALAQELRDELKRAGFKVLLTRSDDEFVDLGERPDLANRRGADLFVSLHFNASPSDAAHVQGPETYCITPVGASSSNAQGEGAGHAACVANRVEQKSLLLAWQVQRALVNNLKVEDRNVRRARFAVLRDAEMPAILVESGYMTHPVEGKKIFTAAYRQAIAAAIVKGILGYQKLTSPPTKATMVAAGASNH